ncbi:MAG: hypothetical protein K8L97_07195 [Anaerolineae bacterium]|nr:hypothetical protein [Anaerolineae bacterium]
MKLAKHMRRLGQACLIVNGIAFLIFFIGIITTPEGTYQIEELPPHVRYAMQVGLALLPVTLILLLGSNIPRILANRALKTKGVPAEARILKVWKTGTRINKKPVLRIVLEVRPPYDHPFEAETEHLLSVAQRISIYPGSIVPVKYNPDNQEVALLNPEDYE